MNKVFAILLMFLLGALGFILHCVQGVLMVAWMIRHPTRCRGVDRETWRPTAVKLDLERHQLRNQKSF